MDSQNNLKLIKYLLEDSVRYVKELVKLSAEGGEFYAAGPQDRIPWAGTKNGSEVMEKNFRIVLEIMEYEVFDAYEFIAQGTQVVAIIHDKAKAKPTGKELESEIVRIYTFRESKIIKIRTFYDTAVYVDALQS